MERIAHRHLDCETLLSDLHHFERQLQLKRRWLVGSPLSASFLENRSLLESFVREDDEFCDRVNRHVENCFGLESPSVGSAVDINEESTLRRVLSSSFTLRSLTNEGLFKICSLLSQGCVDFPKTRKKMMALIMDSLPPSFSTQDRDQADVDLIYELSVILSNPRYVNGNAFSSVIPACTPLGSVTTMLNSLEEMPAEVLLAIYKKLREIPTGTFPLKQKRIGWSRLVLISKIRNIVQKMLSEVDAYDDLPVLVARALAIAHLWSRGSLTLDFDMFSSATKRLQMEIEKAIVLVKTKVRMRELKTLQHLLDPYSSVSNGCLRTSVRKLLTKYLFECSEMDTIPEFLSEALDIVNRGSQAMPYSILIDEDIGKDVDCILNLSAQTKQIAWYLLQNHDFDEDFMDAYMEELEESDEDDSDICNRCLDSIDVTATSVNEGTESEVQTSLNGQCPETSVGECILSDDHESFTSRPARSPLLDKSNSGKGQNSYLHIQDACDDTSMLAYNVIGRIIQNLALVDGLVLDQRDSTYLTGYCSYKDNEDKDWGTMKKVTELIVLDAVKDSFPDLSDSSVDKVKNILDV